MLVTALRWPQPKFYKCDGFFLNLAPQRVLFVLAAGFHHYKSDLIFVCNPYIFFNRISWRFMVNMKTLRLEISYNWEIEWVGTNFHAMNSNMRHATCNSSRKRGLGLLTTQMWISFSFHSNIETQVQHNGAYLPCQHDQLRHCLIPGNSHRQFCCSAGNRHKLSICLILIG